MTTRRRHGITVTADGKTAPAPAGGDDLVSVVRLTKHFRLRGRGWRGTPIYNHAVDDVSFVVKRGETFGLVGESGCGKTTVGRAILRLTPATSGQVYFEGQDLFALSSVEMRRKRRDLQIIFQDPYASLDPRMKIGAIVAEPLILHGFGRGEALAQKVQELLRVVGLQASDARRYPHEFSGGQRQRIGIARALALQPKLVICDEPVSALDVSIQSQILNLLKDLQGRMGLTMIFIAHGLHVVKYVSDRVGVMYLGKLVEIAPSTDIFSDPLHPYTRALISAIPIPDPDVERQRVLLQGDVPSPIDPPPGCRFHTRCPVAVGGCRHEEPALRDLGGGRFLACHLTG